MGIRLFSCEQAGYGVPHQIRDIDWVLRFKYLIQFNDSPVGARGNSVGSRGNSLGTQWELGGSMVGTWWELIGSSYGAGRSDVWLFG